MSNQLIRSLNEPSRLQMIIAYMQDTTDTVRLRPDLELLLDRYRTMDTFIGKFKTRRMCVKYQVERWQISASQASKDYDNTKLVFGSQSRAAKNYDRELIAQAAWEQFRQAKKDKDHNAAGRILDLLRKMNEAAPDDENKEEKEEPKVLIFMPDPELMGVKAIPIDEFQKQKQKWMRSKRKKDVDAMDVDMEEKSDETE
jgi:hypothetical protein